MRMSQQAFNDARVAAKAKPDPTVRVEMGREWSFTLAKRCPQCGATFYAMQPLDAPMEPGRFDPEPKPGDPCGVRDTCGHPGCEKAEDEYQFKRRLAWREEGRA